MVIASREQNGGFTLLTNAVPLKTPKHGLIKLRQFILGHINRLLPLNVLTFQEDTPTTNATSVYFNIFLIGMQQTIQTVVQKAKKHTVY
jgi:hypothetical protein